MRNTASLSEIVGEFKSPDGVQEVRATADGAYNEDSSQPDQTDQATKQ